ncbi:MAG: hypothetical protein KKG33_04085 [candidate division Zixibacteria bacterium]|nr:hypothetical protein [candidate division Zixibacteria bacterium]
MDKHITIIGILYIVFGVLGLLAAGIILVVIAGSGLVSGDPEAMAITGIVAIAVSGFFAIISVPGIIGGIFLLKRKPWARIFVLVLGFLNLIDLPFGTALGIYTIWALMNDETIRLFGQGIAVVPSTN